MKIRCGTQSENSLCTTNSNETIKDSTIRLIISSNPTLTKTGTVHTHRRLGGMLNYYYRDAA